jgi:uncharacterized protein DUF4202
VEGSERLRRAIDAIDAANADDPNRVVFEGSSRPKELLHAELVTAWVHRLTPEPSEALLLAARAHHLRRWTIPRVSYPTGRSGYLRWRSALHEQHARQVAAILDNVGYDAGTIARVQQIVRKRGLGRDPEVQVFEDALCLVFLETQLHDLVVRLDPEKIHGVIEKTTAKMSAQARELALGLDLDSQERALLASTEEP